MTRLIVWIMFCAAGCSTAPSADDLRDHGVDADRDTSFVGGDLGDDADMTPQPTIQLRLELGPRDADPFVAWSSGADVVMIQGPQGGVHTEHRARVSGVDSVDELHLAIIRAEIWRDDLVLGRAGWEFWDDQWEAVDGSYEVELPVLIFDGRPEFGPAELRASLSLTNERMVDYTLPINLVDIP